MKTPAPPPIGLYRCGTCGSPVTTPSRCPVCVPRIGVAVVGCFDCRRGCTFAAEVATSVARKHRRATAHRTWVELEQSVLAPGQFAPTS